MRGRGSFRAEEASRKRHERAAQKNLRELQRRAKEQEKLSILEQARLDVETHENQIELLLSIHKDHGDAWDWIALSTALPPPYPQKNSYHEFQARQCFAVLSPNQQQKSANLIQQAIVRDEEAFQNALQNYADEEAEWKKMKYLARRVLAGEHKAYNEALVEFNPFAEISGLGSQLRVQVHDATLLSCVIKVRSAETIPAEIKTLTSTGKLSVRAMPTKRFHEIYQCYLCACVLRVARELFALLPIDTLLVTAYADLVDPRTGQTAAHPVFSSAMIRANIARLDFEKLDPAHAMENFIHRGDFKASRKLGAFSAINPLTPADLPQAPLKTIETGDAVECVRQLRKELKAELEK